MQKSTSYPFDLFTFSVLLIGVTANANAQQELLDLDFGKFELAQEEMSQLIQIGRSQGRLTLERNWQRLYDRERANQKPGDARAKKLQELIERGYPADRAGEKVDRDLKREARHLEREARLQHDRDGPWYRHRALRATLRKVGYAVDSTGNGLSGGDTVRMHFRAPGYLGEANVDQELLKFVFTHDDSGHSQFLFQDVGNAFIFRFFNNDFVLDLNDNGKRIRLAVVYGESAKVYVASDYAALTKIHPEITDRLLVPLWGKIGVGKPLSFSSPDVMSAAIEKLSATENDEKKVMALISELDSDSFTAREVATNQLMEGFFKWEFLFKNLIETKELTLESKPRANRVLRYSLGTRAQDFVDNRNLLESAEALVELLESVPETDQPIVIRRLKLVTGKEFGNDISRWQSFLKE